MKSKINQLTYAVIGASGNTGSQFVNFLEQNSQKVVKIGRETSNKKKLCESADIIILSIPIQAMSEYILEGCKQKTVISLASVMEFGLEHLKRQCKHVTNIHPMFGPQIKDFSHHNIVIADTNDDSKPFVQLLEESKANCVYMTREKHDISVAIIQALSQFSSLAFGKALAKNNILVQELQQISSVTFRMNLETIKRIVKQDVELWKNIQFYNPHYNIILKEFEAGLHELSSAIHNKDSEAFKKDFQIIKHFLNSESKKSTVGVLGPVGTYSDLMARKIIEAEFIYFDTIVHALQAVKNGRVEYAVVPLENSIHGTVVQTIDGISENNLFIHKSSVLRIEHCLCGQKVAISSPRYIASHPQALAQCAHFLQNKYSDISLVETSSTTKAIQQAVSEPILAIGPKQTAESLGLSIVAENIGDEKNNSTQFVLVSKKSNESKGNKTMLVLRPKSDKKALLYSILSKIKDVNLSKLESRPSRKELGSYVFYIVIDEGDKEKIKTIINNLEHLQINVQNLGTFVGE